MCSYIFFSPFLLCFVYLFFSSHMPPVFLFPICVNFLHTWMKTFGGCMHMHFIICSHMWILKCVYLIYFIVFDVISQDSKVKHVIFDNVCVLACHSICILFLYVSVGHIVCHLALCHLSYVSTLIHDLPFTIQHIH